MASNHSIIRIEATGEMIGDPMEIKLFEFGEFTLNQSLADPEVIFAYESTRGQRGEVFRRFEFDSDLQRMSVVVKVASKEGTALVAYAKGSPEMMATIMEKSSIPSKYNEVLKEYTSNGFRVLAIGSKRIQGNDHKSITREMAETGVIFNGFEVFENKLKPETKGAIRELKDAKIGVVMITGDNALTGSNIGYKCGISHRNQGMIICDYKDGKFT